MREQLGREGITIKLIECSSEELTTGALDYDFRYAELAVWEPVVDAQRLLGNQGLAKGAQSPYLDAALRRLDESTNWKDVRTRLAEIHEIAHHDLPIIPLWQTVNYFAYRSSLHRRRWIRRGKTLQGVGESPLTLYQNVDDWNTSSAANLARVSGEN